jgi:hypothetical protein
VARTARIALYGNAVYVYLQDTALPGDGLGPKGNFIMAVYDERSRRLRYEGAIRGYGARGSGIAEELVELADRVARLKQVGAVPGPRTEQVVSTVQL